MKKIILMILLIFILVIITGCVYKGYSGEHSDLYTVAINIALWNNGHSFSADRCANPEIEIIDEDMYGRKMFTYYEKHYAGSDISFAALIICQNSNEKDVFYYEDINFIVKEQIEYTYIVNEFKDEEMEQLKAANDWNQEINFDKCIKKEIIKKKPGIPNEEDVKNKIIDEFNLSSDRGLFVDFLTSDSANSKFIIYGYIRKYGEDDVSFIGLAESDQESLKEVKFLVPTNVYDYKTEFMEFKKINNWV